MQNETSCENVEAPNEPELQIVYILTNPSMPGLLKIGRTTNLDARVAALSSATAVPEPFEVAYAAWVEDAPFVERAMHSAFSMHKMPGREFFRVGVANAIAALSLAEVRPVILAVDDETPSVVSEVRQRSERRRDMGYDVIDALKCAGRPVTNKELARLMSVSDGEASKRRREVGDLLSVEKVGKETRIALKT